MPPVYSCTIDGCARPAVSRGYCKRHYERLRINGDPLRLRRKGPKPTPTIQRFLDSFTVVPETGCWEWTGHKTPNGYGGFTPTGATATGAHRWSFEWFVGPIGSGFQIDHLCRNRACVNPDHVEPVTCAENIRRGETGKWQTLRTHCPKGHPYNETNTIRRDGKRSCRECARLRCAGYYAAKKAAAR